MLTGQSAVRYSESFMSTGQSVVRSPESLMSTGQSVVRCSEFQCSYQYVYMHGRTVSVFVSVCMHACTHYYT